MLKYLKIKLEVLWELKKIYTMANVTFSLTHNTTEKEFTVEDIQLSRTIYYEA